MALTNLASVMAQAGLSSVTDAQSAQFRSLINGVTSLVKQQLNRDLELQSYTEYYSGNNRPFLVLRQFPVVSVTRVSLNGSGYFGDGPDGFPTSNDLVAGVGYALMDGLNGKGGTGILRRIGGTWSAPSYRELGTVENLAPVPIGNILVTYTAGYAAGAIPAAIVMAVNDLIIRKALMAPVGGAAQSMGYEDANVSLFSPAEAAKLMGSLEATLANYRSIAI